MTKSTHATHTHTRKKPHHSSVIPLVTRTRDRSPTPRALSRAPKYSITHPSRARNYILTPPPPRRSRRARDVHRRERPSRAPRMRRAHGSRRARPSASHARCPIGRPKPHPRSNAPSTMRRRRRRRCDDDDDDDDDDDAQTYLRARCARGRGMSINATRRAACACAVDVRRPRAWATGATVDDARPRERVES